MHDLVRQLARRRDDLGLSNAEIARRTGLGIATVHRAMSPGGNARLATLATIASVLGSSVSLVGNESASAVREAQARARAHELVGLVQGSAALEGQAVGDAAVAAMVERTVVELLRGSNRRLWSE